MGNPVYGLGYARGKADGVVEVLAKVAEEVASATNRGRLQGAVGTLGVVSVVGVAAYGVAKLDPWNIVTRTRNLFTEQLDAAIDEDLNPVEDQPAA